MEHSVDVIAKIDLLAEERKCFCGRQWHTLALTHKMAAMIDSGRIDPNYFAREDTSEILCEGSDLIGPRRPPYVQSSDYTKFHYADEMMKWPTMAAPWVMSTDQSGYAYQELFAPSLALSPPWLSGLIETTIKAFGDVFANLNPLKVNLWLPGDPEPELPCKPPPEVDIEFGPQNWMPPTGSLPVPVALSKMVWKRWGKFTKPDIALPAKPPMDFSHLNTQPYWITNKKGKK